MEQPEDTTKIYPTKNLGDLLCSSDKVAVIESSSKTITYNLLESRAQSVAAFLANRPKSNIGIVAHNSINFICAYLGILKAGHTAVLISSKFPAGTLNYILEDSNVKLVFSDTPVDAEENILLDTVDTFTESTFVSVQPSTDDIAVILYTSGSTGVPKGVNLTHAGHRWILEQRVKSNNFSQVRMLIAAPCYHMNGLSVLETALLGGATAILLPFFEATLFVKSIEKYSVNLITSVPSMMASILDLVKDANVSSVRQIIMASAPVSRKLFKAVKERFPNAGVRIAYGITEVGPGIFGKHPTLSTPDFSVGYPIKGVSYRLVDGILEIKSPSMLSSYTNKDLKTTSDGYFITGDLFSVDQDGFYYFEGRADDMFVCGGHNIYPSKIESVLEQHELVELAAVIGISDDIKGVKPYVFLKIKNKNLLDEVKDYAFKNLPVYEVPREFFCIDELPLSSIGKVDKKSLADMATKLLLENNLG